MTVPQACDSVAAAYRPLRLARRLPAVVLLLTAGCVTAHLETNTHVERGAPIDSSRVDQIVIGQTTRADIFKWLGPPHSMFRDSAELLEHQNVRFYSYAQSRRLQTIDETQYALLYRFDRTEAHSKIRIRGLAPFWRGDQEIDVSFAGDELLVLLDRDTHVVTDIARRTGGASQ